MKLFSLIKYPALILGVVLVAFYIVSCNKEVDSPNGNNRVELQSTGATSLSYTGSVVSANLSTLEKNSLSDHGFCWGTLPNPDLNSSTTHLGSRNETGIFTAELTDLQPNTRYFVRSFATITGGTLYSAQSEFTTLKTGKPKIHADSVNSITQNSVICWAKIVSDSGLSVASRGICWNTTPNPVNSDNHLNDGNGTGAFDVMIPGLQPSTVYYVRAYATNNAGISYSNQQTFTTLAISSPSLTTTKITEIASNSAIGGGDITNDGGASITDKGICWSTAQNPTITDNHTNQGSGIGVYTSNLVGLSPNTTYYVRAYASNSAGRVYGPQKSFTTLPASPSLTTTSAISVTSTSAVSGGNITSDGGATITDKGVCWSTSQNPTIANSHTNQGTGTGAFTSNITGLLPGTLYYVRAYASSSAGRVYGGQKSFTTLPATIVLTTTSATSVTSISAISGGNISSDGGAAITDKGVCWSTSQNPTIANSHTNQGTGTGAFTSNLTGLAPATTYYVRAYASNISGRVYGNQVSLTTATNCVDFTKTHTAGAIAPVTKSVSYQVVSTSLSGSPKCWITRNLGAGQKATTATDATEASAGWYWQFNKKQGFKHDGTTRTPNTTWITSISENSDWLPANDPCALLLGNGWRLPTKTEWTNADATDGWDNYNETFASALRLHTAGFLGSGSLSGRGSDGRYWSSSQYSSDGGWYLYFHSSGSGNWDSGKTAGHTVRCLKDDNK